MRIDEENEKSHEREDCLYYVKDGESNENS